ncbi:MAG: Inositol-1-monophosphatase [Alphaproteobacteria bacterium ADurb.Bin438]|nr:MAG: Inositol-1-monophosphatase [Alphaproteobacteria bacterium ADurb.Bin438]
MENDNKKESNKRSGRDFKKSDRPRSFDKRKPRDSDERSERRSDRPRSFDKRGPRDSDERSERRNDRPRSFGGKGKPRDFKGRDDRRSDRPRSFDKRKPRVFKDRDENTSLNDQNNNEQVIENNIEQVSEEKVMKKESFNKKVTFSKDDLPSRKGTFKSKSAIESRNRQLSGGRLEIAVGNLSANLNVMISCIHKAGRGLAYDFNELSRLNIRKKADNSFVSEADLRAEESLVTNLNKVRSDFGFILEEGGVKEGSDKSKYFIIDPLDGTSNFLHGIPHFAISVAMVINDEVVAGVIYNPISDETFYAEKGNGSYILTNGTSKRIRVSDTTKFEDCIIGTGIPNCKTPNHIDYIKKLERIMSHVDGVRRNGSAALDMAYVAAGRFDGYFETSMLKPWDIAAGLLIVKEAGGYVCNTDEQEQDKQILFENCNIIACNDNIKNNFKDMLL